MITIKKPEHFERMAHAGLAVAAVHRAVRRAAKPGVTTHRLEPSRPRFSKSTAVCLPS